MCVFIFSRTPGKKGEWNGNNNNNNNIMTQLLLSDCLALCTCVSDTFYFSPVLSSPPLSNNDGIIMLLLFLRDSFRDRIVWAPSGHVSRPQESSGRDPSPGNPPAPREIPKRAIFFSWTRKFILTRPSLAADFSAVRFSLWWRFHPDRYCTLPARPFILVIFGGETNENFLTLRVPCPHGTRRNQSTPWLIWMPFGVDCVHISPSNSSAIYLLINQIYIYIFFFYFSFFKCSV